MADQGSSAAANDPQEASSAAATTNTTNDNEDWKIQLEASKSLGDTAFRSGHYDTAIHHYTAALSLDPEHAVLLSNRSAAHLKSGQKSKALYDAQACCKLNTLGVKGTSRLAAALQALGRYQPALTEWERILQQEPQHAAALKGKQDCTAALEEKQKAEEEAKREQELKDQQEQAAADEEKAATDQPDGMSAQANKEDNNEDGGDEEDDLDDFFNDVEDATNQVAQEKELAAAEPVPKATNAIKHHRKNLGSVAEQIDRLLSDHYEWRNLNPFHVLDLPHTASMDDISRRYKALSLLLHPDKNRNNNNVDTDKVQLAYDQVQKAKAALDDEDKAKHAKQLIQAGMKQGKDDWGKQQKVQASGGNGDHETLETLQSKAVQRIFAQVEMKRRQVEQRERNYEQRERQQEEEELQKEKRSRDFDNKWQQEERVDSRIGNWRDFTKKKKRKK